MSVAAEKFELSGYARLIGGHLDTADANFKGYNDSFKASPDSLVSVQGVFQANEKLSLTAQLMARLDEDQDSGIEWLYLTYLPLENVQIKAGKLRTPFFTLSDVTDVGYAYPWVNPPQQVYNAYLFDTFNGLDIIYGFGTDKFDADIEVYAGRYENGSIELADVKTSYKVDRVQGVIGNLRYGNLQLRAARYGGRVNLDSSELSEFAKVLDYYRFPASADTLATKGDVDVTQVGLVYDNLNYFSRMEWVDIQTELEIAPAVESYYVTFGYYLTPFTLHFTYANSVTSKGRPANDIPIGFVPELDQLANAYLGIFDRITSDNLDTYTLGVRWDFRPNMALKLDYSRLEGKPEDNSFFNKISSDDFDRKANLYTVGLEWVF
ncbi:hypothetical protein [Teredinibacter haidensis]|uniref:hypothetical protein n=1 Tax=Teredinibacter haidensis TaxID=2731755 RepID=UPI000948DCE8|nr:hypothetical protein [Teredinibacter haidensis]